MLGRRLTALAALALSFLLAAACGDDAATGGGGSGGSLEPEVCDAHASPTPLLFSDRSEAWGLAGVVGGRLSSGDLNGDGYPDLLVHSIYTNEREVVGGTKRRIFLLMNEPSPAGGRTFVDRTYESGFARPADGGATELRSAQLAVMADVDNDGDLDVFSGTWANPPAAGMPETPADLDRSEIYLNDGTGRFSLKAGSGVQGDRARPTAGASFVDVDRNGIVDLFVGMHRTSSGAMQPASLLLGAGDGTFSDVSAAAGITAEKRAGFGTTACDLDDDGSPELIVSAYARGPNVLFQSNGGGGYVDVGEASGFAFDGEQDWNDNQFFLCWCTVNASDPLCAGAPSPDVLCPDPPDGYWSPSTETEPERLGGNTFTTACADVDGDGKLDLYNAEIAHWWAGSSSDKSNLLYNRGDGGTKAFERADRAAKGLEVPHVGASWNEGGITAAIADLDLDARPDILLGTSDYPDQYSWIFRQREDGTFEEVGEAIGLHHECTVGMAVADFDRDGDLDVVVATGFARDPGCAELPNKEWIHMYESAGSGAGWIAVRLRGGGSGAANAAGIGARVAIEAGGVRQVQEIGGGYGHMGMQNDTVVFAAIGGCTRAHKIEVTWPDAARTVEVWEEVQGGRLIELRQGDAEVHEIVPASGG